MIATLVKAIVVLVFLNKLKNEWIFISIRTSIKIVNAYLDYYFKNVICTRMMIFKHML